MTAALLLFLAFAQSGLSPQMSLARQAHDDFQAGRYVEARDKLRQAVQSSPRNPALWSLLGMTDSRLNDVDAAIADFQKTLDLAPDDAQSCFNLGLLYGRKQDIARATEAYRRGLLLDSENAPANQNYALLLM